MELLDFTAARKDLEFRQGQSVGPFTFSNFVDGEDVILDNISGARVTVREGTLANPGDVVSSITVAPVITDGSQVSWSLTPTQTRLLTPGGRYCYEFEITFDSYEQGIVEGIGCIAMGVSPSVATIST